MDALLIGLQSRVLNSIESSAPSNSSRLAEQAAARYPRAVAQGAELGPNQLLGDTAQADGGLETAIGRGNDALWIAQRACGTLQPISDHLGMLDIIGRRVNRADK